MHYQTNIKISSELGQEQGYIKSRKGTFKNAISDLVYEENGVIVNVEYERTQKKTKSNYRKVKQVLRKAFCWWNN